MSVYSIFIHKNQNLETTQMLLCWGTDKWTGLSMQCNVTSNKKAQSMIHTSTQIDLKCIMLNERSQIPRLPTVWFHLHIILKRQNYRIRKYIRGCQGLGSSRGSWLQRAWGIFEVIEIFCNLIITVGICLSKLAEL